MKQAYKNISIYLLLIAIYLVSTAGLLFDKLGVANANDLCDSDSGICKIENREFTVEHGDSYDNDSRGPLYVGYKGDGRLNIYGGGSVKVESFLQMALNEGSSGFIEVSGQNAKLDVGADLNVGVEGNGFLLISDKARVISNSLSEDYGGQIGLEGKGNYGIAEVTTEGVWDVGDSLIIGQDNGSNGTLIINKSGEVSVGQGTVELAQRHGSKGHIYIGAKSGEAAVAAGELKAGEIQFGSGDGYLVFNHTDNMYEFSPDLTGAGTVQNENGKTILVGDNSDFSGNINLFGGVISVNNKNNIGKETAILNFDGGALQVEANDFGSTNQDINIGSKHAHFHMDFNSDNGESMILTGNMAGVGDLIKYGRGDLELRGNNNYGNTIIEDGELIGNSDSISGNVYLIDKDTSAVTFDQNHDAVFAGDILTSDNSLIGASKIGTGVLKLTGVSNTGWNIEEGELISSAERFGGNLFVHQAGTMTFEQAQNSTFQGFIEGDGAIQKTGPGKLILSNNSADFKGNTIISAGTLAVTGNTNAALGGNIDIHNGAVLAGTGTVGTANTGHVTVHSGGSIAPGNSIGTLKVAGDLTFQPGSKYEVEVDPNSSASDKIEVGGTASLAGSVIHIGLNGDYGPSSTYNILTANNGIQGTFDNATSDFAFLTPVLNYDANNVNLTLARNNVEFADYAITRNQKATAGGLASLPAGSSLLQKAELLPADTPAEIFDGLSGEVHAGLISALEQNSSLARSFALSHLRNNLGAGYRPGAPIAQASDLPVPAGAMPSSAALPMWAELIGSRQNIKGNNNAASFKQNTSGIFVGGDFAIGNGWRMGGSFGYTNSRMRMDDRNSKADIDTYTAAVYGGKSFAMETASLNLLLGGSYSWHRVKTERNVYLNDWNHKLKSRYKANTSQLFGELSYTTHFGDTSIEPFAGLAWTRLNLGSFSESGGPTALSAGRHTQNNTSTTLGLRTNTKFDLGRSAVNLQLSLGWRHAFGRIDPKRTMAFAGGRDFTITGAPIARDSAVVGLAAGFDLSKNARLGLAYDGQFGGGNKYHGGSLNLSWQF